MRNKDVIRSFAWGKRAAAGNLQTDGRSLWSYNLKIAQRTPEGVVVGDFTAPGGGFHSMTTSKHVGMDRIHGRARKRANHGPSRPATQSCDIP